MAIIRDDTQQTGAHLSVTMPDGERRQAVSATCHINPGKSMSISVDVLDAAAITGDNRAALAAAVAEYIGEELRKAARLGVPVDVPAAKP